VNMDQVLSAVRTIVGLLSGYAIGRGLIDAEQATLIAGLAAAIVPFAWGMYAHSKQQKLASVAAMPNVEKVVTTDQKTADAAPSAKVISVMDQAMGK